MVKAYYSLDSALYTIEKQTRTTSLYNKNNNNNNGDATVKPIKSRSSIECILKCRIKLKESFYVAETSDEENCYCLHNKDDQRELSSQIVTKTDDDDEETTIDGLYMNEHQVCI